MGDDVAYVGEPTLLGDHGAVVPAVAQGPEVEPAHPARALWRWVQLDVIKIETGQHAPDGKLNFVQGGDREQNAGGVRLIVIAVALGVAEDIDVHAIPALQLPEQRLAGLDALDAIDRHRLAGEIR